MTPKIFNRTRHPGIDSNVERYDPDVWTREFYFLSQPGQADIQSDLFYHYTKPFTDFTTEDFNALVSTNLLGFLYITQLTVKQMLKQKSGSVVTISASLVDQPFTGEKASVSMITKGGLNSVTRSLAIEYARETESASTL
ncbi:MAG: SDR family oxidoreductase [Candidatus Acidiferrales bacterium]